jgi:hypothetical protein
VHSLRATAATNALDNKADIAKVQEWLGHANVSLTRLYDGSFAYSFATTTADGRYMEERRSSKQIPIGATTSSSMSTFTAIMGPGRTLSQPSDGMDRDCCKID